MKIENNGKILIADKGKTFICKCHNVIFGSEVYLNNIMINGILKMDSSNNYEEIDDIECDENDNI